MSGIQALREDHEFGYFDSTHDAPQQRHPELISNENGNHMLRAITHELRRSTEFIFSVAFITPSALAMLKQTLLDYRGQGTIITSTYLGFNDPNMFRELLKLQDKITVLIYDEDAVGFHSKGYYFIQPDGTTTIVGSSNLTRHALVENQEWNLRFSAMPDGDINRQVAAALIRQQEQSKPLTEEWIRDYEARRVVRAPVEVREAGLAPLAEFHGKIQPNAMQCEALEALEQMWVSGAQRGLIISATGTGKTILAALSVKEFDRIYSAQKVLFVVHREQILDKAIEEFQKVLGRPRSDFGKIVGGSFEKDKPFVFATVQSLSTQRKLDRLDPDEFDYILIDESHRAGSPSYLNMIEFFTPRFLLGLTATPERTDDFNVFELFHYNVVCEIRLERALDEKMLVPFHYYGVQDYTTLEGEVISDDFKDLESLVLDDRVRHVVAAIEKYGHVDQVKGLIFCSRKDEAAAIARKLGDYMVNGRPLKARALSGEDPIPARQEAVDQLERGELDYLLTVDIFNEGIDIPAVNQVVMLRGTQSSIIFTQQLGRGLRKNAGKDHLRVIDFIGNYTNNYLIPMALAGTRDKEAAKSIVTGSSVLAGASSVSFDEVSQRRIFESLEKAQLGKYKVLAQQVAEIARKLGKIPTLLDVELNGLDSVLVATAPSATVKNKKELDENYWTFLNRLSLAGFPEVALPSSSQAAYLRYLSGEVLNGKRAQELVILRSLLEEPGREWGREELKAVLRDAGLSDNDGTLASALNILDLTFHTQQERTKYRDLPLIQKDSDVVILAPHFAAELSASLVFADHVYQVVEAGLYLARHRYTWGEVLTPGKRYTRKDACRLLNWSSNRGSVIYGYKTDEATMTCPIFVTYDKSEEIEEHLAYNDSFINECVMHWFSRNKKTVQKKEIQYILSSSVSKHLFVKRNDGEEGEFYYCGEVVPEHAENQKREAGKLGLVDVVAVDFSLKNPLSTRMFDYFSLSTKGGSEESAVGPVDLIGPTVAREPDPA